MPKVHFSRSTFLSQKSDLLTVALKKKYQISGIQKILKYLHENLLSVFSKFAEYQINIRKSTLLMNQKMILIIVSNRIKDVGKNKRSKRSKLKATKH